MEKKKIAVIGCGNLGHSLINGLIDGKNVAPQNITATKRNIESIRDLEKEGVNITSNNQDAVSNAEVVLLALKPYNILSVLEDIKPKLDAKKHIIVSLATGISIQQIRDVLKDDFSVYRAMPNTAADVNQSLTCICSSKMDENSQLIQQIFNQIGETVIIDEKLMDSATVLGACGVAFVLRFMRAMVQGGIQIGFDSKTAAKIVNQTVKGAAELLIQNGNHPEDEIDKVTTPKGCTIKGLNEMEHNGFSSALIKGIVSSFDEIEK